MRGSVVLINTAASRARLREPELSDALISGAIAP
jgi:hypothetical protein